MVRVEYDVATHRCPSCNTPIARHSSLFTHVEPVVRTCAKCNSEVVVTTCNEWELLSDKQRAIYNLRLMQRVVYRGMTIFLAVSALVWILFQLGIAYRLLSLLPLEIHFNRFAAFFWTGNPLIVGVKFGIIIVALCEAAWLWQHFVTLRNSRKRMADQNYRDRVTAIMRSGAMRT